MAFCAILHKFRPKMIPFSTLSPHNARDNLLLAFRVAEDYFGLEQVKKEIMVTRTVLTGLY